MGKIGQEIPADAIVVCTGAQTAQVLYQTLGVYCPITPVKSYTFDVETQAEYTPTHLMMHEQGLMACFLKPGLMRMSLFGDLAGASLDCDNRRLRMARNTVCISLNKEEGLMAQNIKAVLRACSPDDLPVIGPLKTHPNLYLNSGHGGRGSALSLASSKLVAELLQDGKCKSLDKEFDHKILAPLRYQL